MANPQSEEGHTRISNELLEAILLFPFTGQELKIVMYIARETYGWSRKKASISYGAISRYTKISRRNSIVLCQRLIHKQVLFSESKGDRRANVMGIQKNYAIWKPVDNLVMHRTLPSDAQDTRSSDAQDTRKIKSSDAQDTRSSDAQDTTSKQKAIRLKQAESKEYRLKEITITRSRIGSLIAGKESCITNCDPRPVIRILIAEGLDPVRCWGALMQCKTKRNPAGYLVKSLADPNYAIADNALEKGKAEMLRWEEFERAASESTVSESAALISSVADRLCVR